ncbi:SH3 domain-containing protein [Chryseobacterium binzhouense]|uniref:SH3 domain-containing protein n=1 Tax=Chryseobacterium binzhouense TaxID=2593646 RepID=UPI00289BCA45|nr:SH3 domain-containing protein [Chryseobacterium binzhouense]
MKTFVSIFIIFFGVLMAGSFTASEKENLHKGGRCTGSSSCSACSSCSGCAHCADRGGTCGVCSGSSYKKKSFVNPSYSKQKKSKTPVSLHSKHSKKSKTTESPKIRIDEVIINTDNKHTSTVSLINIYEKPSLQSKIIEKTSGNAKLIPISIQKYWRKVKVPKSGKTGYVYYKDVK